MNPECEKTITTAAGRALTKAEFEGIEERITSSMRELAGKDPNAWFSMSSMERRVEAAKLAKENMVKDVVRAHEATIREANIVATRMTELNAVAPGKKGQVHHVKNMIVDTFNGLETKTSALAASVFRHIENTDNGKLFGLLQDPAKNADIVAALYGEHSSPEAAAAAAQIKNANDMMAKRFKASGLPLHELEDYLIPQGLESTKTAGFTKERFIERQLGRLDRNKLVAADGSRMTDQQVRDILATTYESVISDGASKRISGEALGGSALVGRNKNAPRRLFYKDSASWQGAMEDFGRSSSVYDLFNSHIQGMAKDVVIAETFGRNADTNFQKLIDTAYNNDVQTLAGSGEKPIQKLDAMRNSTQKMFDAIVHPARPENAWAANLHSQLRSLMGASQLGVMANNIVDLAGMKMAADLHGLPQFRLFHEVVKNTFAGAERQSFLRRTGLWMEGMQHAATRMGIDDVKNGPGTWLYEINHKLMGMSAFDRGLRSSNGIVLMDMIGEFTRKFSKLADADGESALLKKAGVEDIHWDVWKAAEPEKWDGRANLITPDSIAKIPDSALDPIAARRLAARSKIFSEAMATRDAQIAAAGGNEPRIQEYRDAFAAKYTELLAEERTRVKSEATEKLLQVSYGQMQFGARGASGASIADRAAMGLESAKDAGTFSGEFKRYAWQFKAVPLGIFRQHWDAMQGMDTYGARAAYGAKFVGYSTLLGALAIELKALINGQDPRTMNVGTDEGKKFWTEALATGSGFGLYGDFLLNDRTAQGSGAEVFMGPGVSAVMDAAREVNRARVDATSERESNHPYALSSLRWVRRNATPFANLWYTKAAFNRLVYDQLQDQLAPGSSDRQRRRMEQRGAQYWWAPGTLVPQRAPDLGNAVE